MIKLPLVISLLGSLANAYAADSTPTISKAQYQATTGFMYAQEIVQAGRYFNKSYQQCPSGLKDIGLDNIQQLTANLFASATIDESCQVTVTYANQDLVAKELQGKTITIKPNSKELTPLAGECSFDGPAELAPPKDCKTQAIPYLTTEETNILDGFVAAYRTHNPALLKADTLNEVSSMMLLPKMMVGQFYKQHQRCPANNQEANLSAPEQLSVRFLKSIEVSGCDITATFKNEDPVPKRFKGKTVTYTLHPNANAGEFDWLCQSDLAKRDLPKDCRSE